MQDLKAQAKELESKVTQLQVDTAKTFYELKFDDVSIVSRILQHIDKDYEWQSRNAALAVHVYDKLKAEKARISSSDVDTTDGITINMQATELTGLYNILLNITGSGVEKARSFTRLLTNVGQQVSESMEVLAKKNEEIQAMHAELRDLEYKIQENEISKQVEEEVTNS